MFVALLLFSFPHADLDGGWSGELKPDSSDFAPRNFFLRFDDGAMLNGLEGDGACWSSISADQTLLFTVQGDFRFRVECQVEFSKLEISGTMNTTLNRVNGSFSLLSESGRVTSGTFELRRSTGVGYFDLALIDGSWEGTGSNDTARFRIIDFEADDFGTMLSGPGVDSVLGPGFLQLSR